MGKRKSLKVIFYSLSLLLVSACTSVDEYAIGVKEFSNLVDEKNCIVVDVRTPEEFLEGHIKGAATIDLYSADFEHKFRFINTSQCMALYCKGGYRSGKALKILQEELGFKNLVYLKGGVTAWETDGYDLVEN